jgi:NADH-quinone oxidoreductase subunit G
VEQDLFRGYGDRLRVEQALNKVKLLLVLDYLPSSSVKRAHGVLPTASLFERTPATFVNQEGRAQQVSPVHRGGTPLSQVSGGKHPPRTFLDHIPGGEPRAAHEVIEDLYTAISGQDKTLLLEGRWEGLGAPSNGTRLLGREQPEGRAASGPAPAYSAKEGMELLLVDWTFGTEELSGYSRFAVTAESTPCCCMHPEDAGRLGLAEGDRIALAVAGGEVALRLSVAPSMAAGVIVAPRHRQIRWQELKQGPNRVTDQQIHKL